MRVTRLHCDADLVLDKAIVLDQEATHYLLRVLRLESGDRVRLFNGRDGEYEGSVTGTGRNEARVTLDQKLRDAATPALQIELAMGLVKGDRMDLAIQKATELGAGAIIPLYTRYSEVRFRQASRLDNKLRHWRRIAINACEQCERLVVPRIESPQAIEDWLSGPGPGSRLLLDPQASSRFAGLAIEQPVTLLVGPEGGLSGEEIELACRQGFQALSLGPRILRAETAPLAALAILQHLYGDM